VIEPVTPGHFCECCGRKLSLQERKALDAETLAPAAVHLAHTPEDRLVGVQFNAPALVDPVPVDPVPAVHVGHALVHPSLEAHFAGEAPQEPVAPVYVAANAPVETAPASRPVAPAWTEPVLVSPMTAYEPVESMFVDAPAATLDSDAPGHRCEICGADAQDSDLCEACRSTYHSLLESKTFPLPAQAANAAAQPVSPDADVAPEVAAAASEAPAEPVPEPAPEPAPLPAMEVAAPIRVRPVVEFVAVPAPEPIATAAPSLPPPPKAAKPVRPVTPVAAAAAPTSRTPGSARTVAAGAAVVVVLAAIGFPLGKLWLGHQEAAPIIREDQPRPIATPVAAPAPPPRVVQTSATTSVAASAVQPPPKAATVAAVTPKTVAAVTAKPVAVPRTAPGRVPSKTTLKPNALARPAAAVAIPSPVAVVPAPEVAAPAPVVAPAPKPEPPAAPVGPFFELRDVNETPRVANRVEPQVPDDLRDRSLNEVVIVRVLVTQAGHPQIVTLLRRSKSGPSLDDAIVAAVKQWTFVPARKRGEAVSCWYHVGVAVKAD
jgi:nicotinate-nucleotide--dimethylbenzimidazole phosphoribosyltransferase